MRSWILMSLCLALAGASGCATRQSFMPAENVTDVVGNGYYAAHYEIRQPGGAVEVKVWSGGSFTSDVDGDRAAYAHVGFVVHNDSQVPIRLDLRSVRLEASTSQGKIGPLLATETEGSGDLPGGSKSELEVLFRLPDEVSATEVRDFDVAWALTSGRQRYAQHTPFLKSVPQPLPRHYYSPFDDPYYWYPGARGRVYFHYPYYSPGFGRHYGVPGRR